MSNAPLHHNPVIATGLQTMRFGRGFAKMVLDKTDDDLFFSIPYHGANHAAWVVGHLATTDEFILTTMTGAKSVLPEGWGKLFGGGSTCEAGSKKYPSRKELMTAFDERRAAIEKWYTSLPDDQLHMPVEGEIAMFLPTRSALGGACGFHDGFHAAQISAARRASGLPPMF